MGQVASVGNIISCNQRRSQWGYPPPPNMLGKCPRKKRGKWEKQGNIDKNVTISNFVDLHNHWSGGGPRLKSNQEIDIYIHISFTGVYYILCKILLWLGEGRWGKNKNEEVWGKGKKENCITNWVCPAQISKVGGG